jgi:type I restriction enzyme S subunit
MVFLKDVISKPITGEWGTDGEETNILRTTNFTNSGVIDFSDVVKRTIPERKVELKKLLKGDIIIEKSGGSPKQPVGRVVFFNSEGTYLCNNFTSVLRPKREKVDPKYLHYILFASHKFGITSVFQNKTTGIINLQLPRYVEKLPIPLPTLKTQQRIAGILDNAAALRDKTAQLLTEYDLLAQSIFLEMFGDPTKGEIIELKESTDILGGYAFKSSDFIEDGIPLVKIGTVNKGYFDLKNSSFLPADYLKKYEKWVVYSGDMLMSLTGTVGKDDYGNIEIVTSEHDQYFLNQRVAKLETNKDYNSSFFYYMFLQVPVKRLLTKISRGVRQANISNNDILKLKLIRPKIALQNEFADKIALIEQQKTLAKQELQESEDLFNCLLQQAFKGEL